MKNIIGFVMIVLCFFSCFREKNKITKNNFEKNVELITNVKYAKGFTFKVLRGKNYLILRNPKDTNEIYSTIKIIQSIPKSSQEIQIPLNHIALQSTTMIPFVEKLKPKSIKGICYTKNVKSENTKSRIQKNEIVELLSTNHIDYEKLISLNVDLTFVYPFDQNEIKTLKEMNIPYILCFEYLEEGVLAKAEWIKFFGILFNKQKEANDIFENIEKNITQIKPYKERGLTLINLPFGDSWNMPPGNSSTAQLLKKSGFDYAYKNTKSQGNLSVPFEKIIEIGTKAPNWIIFASRPAKFSIKNLISENKIYQEFLSVKNKQVYFCNTSITPYFEEAIIEPHQLILDLKECANLGKDTKYFKKLK